MKVFIVVLAIVAAINGLKYFPNHMPLSDDLIHYINYEAGTTWMAGRNFERTGMTISGLKKMCGVLRDPNNFKLPYRVPHPESDDVSDVPTEFDSRTKWPNCTSVV